MREPPTIRSEATPSAADRFAHLPGEFTADGEPGDSLPYQQSTVADGAVRQRSSKFSTGMMIPESSNPQTECRAREPGDPRQIRQEATSWIDLRIGGKLNLHCLSC